MKIIISVSLTFVVSFVIVFIVYVRRRATLSRRSFFRSLFVDAPDKWEVNPGDMTLLERLGDGFFGIVHKAHLYQRTSRNFLALPEKERSSLGNEKLVVACKMLKGIEKLCSICFQFIIRFL